MLAHGNFNSPASRGGPATRYTAQAFYRQAQVRGFLTRTESVDFRRQDRRRSQVETEAWAKASGHWSVVSRES